MRRRMAVQDQLPDKRNPSAMRETLRYLHVGSEVALFTAVGVYLSLIHISEPTRPY